MYKAYSIRHAYPFFRSSHGLESGQERRWHRAAQAGETPVEDAPLRRLGSLGSSELWMGGTEQRVLKGEVRRSQLHDAKVGTVVAHEGVVNLRTRLEAALVSPCRYE